MAAKAHSPLSTPHPLLLPVLPEKECVAAIVFLILLFGLFRAVNTQNLSTRVPYGNHAFPLETSIPTVVMMLFVMDFNLLIMFGNRCYSVPIQLALLFECGS